MTYSSKKLSYVNQHATFRHPFSCAKVSPRLWQNYDLRNNAEDNSQRMLNALEPGTVLFESKDRAWEPLAEEDIMK